MTGSACDTSVLVPAVVPWHPAHRESRAALVDVGAVAAHVLLETYSVLTRLPPPHRIAPADAAELIAALPFTLDDLAASSHVALVQRLASSNIRGGAVYDALVAATALQQNRLLLTRDRRAIQTYDAVGVRYSLL